MTDSNWLSETRPDGAVTVILLGPSPPDVIAAEAEAFPAGVLWLHPRSFTPHAELPQNLVTLPLETPAETLSETLDRFLRLEYDHAPAVEILV